MAKNQQEFDKLISAIESGEFSGDKINLWCEDITDSDCARLCAALKNSPNVAARIKTLRISCNKKLTSVHIPDTLVILQELYLSSNMLTSVHIPDTLVGMDNLDLSSNMLTSIHIPHTLVKLSHLGLSDNQLTSIHIPHTLVALFSLQLCKNKLTSINIPNTLVILEHLNLCSNMLTSIHIPHTLVILEHLNLCSNMLTSIHIPHTLVALQRLYLRYNQLTSIHIPHTLVKLSNLVLSYNQLTSIDIPHTLVALYSLELCKNKLTSIHIPHTLVKLIHLKLSDNQLTSIHIPHTLVKLSHLVLSDNQLTSIHIPHTLAALDALSIKKNRLNSADTLLLSALKSRPGASIRFDRIFTAITQPTAQKITQRQELFFSASNIYRIHTSHATRIQITQDILTVYLIMASKNILGIERVSSKIIEFLLHIDIDINALIDNYSLRTMYGWLPAQSQLSADVYAAIDAAEQQARTTTNNKLISYQRKLHAQVASMPILKALVDLNAKLAERGVSYDIDEPKCAVAILNIANDDSLDDLTKKAAKNRHEMLQIHHFGDLLDNMPDVMEAAEYADVPNEQQAAQSQASAAGAQVKRLRL